MKKQSLIITLLASSLLTACGGSSTKSTPKTPQAKPTPVATTTYGGKVIDGYVAGATVWLDINGNGVHDKSSEPFTVSKAAGDYAFEFTAEQAKCVPYATLFVSVPVGAIDEDLGEVTQAYQMAFPPALGPIDNKTLLNISPLTSIIWEQLSAKLKKQDSSLVLSCDSLISDENLRASIKDEIQQVTNETVSFYNISAEQIYADFIKQDDSKAYDLAQSIVIGLKAAYQQRIKLQESNPGAEIRVRVYQSKEHDQYFQFENGWYRDTVIFDNGKDFIEHVKLKGKESLSTVDMLLSRLEALEHTWGDDTTYAPSLRVRDDIYRRPNGRYDCSNSEYLYFTKNNVKFGIYNSSPSKESIDGENCLNDNLETPFERGFSFRYRENGNNYLTNLYFREQKTTFSDLPQWVNVKDKSDTLDLAELATYLEGINYKFDDEVIIPTSYWYKRKTSGNVTIDKANDGVWTKRVVNNDGTTTKTCSPDGIIYSSCSD